MNLNYKSLFWACYFGILILLVALVPSCADYGDYYRLKEIRADVMNRFEPSDEPLNYWPKSIPATGPLRGDCKLFATAVLQEMRRQNIPGEMVLVAAPGLQGHVIVRSGMWAIDNRQQKIVRYSSLFQPIIEDQWHTDEFSGPKFLTRRPGYQFLSILPEQLYEIRH